MKRECFVLKSSRNYGSGYNRHICIDLENQDKIISAIKGKEKKFWQIVERTVTQDFIYWDCYTKEKTGSKSGNISAIKFFDKENTRIYCQELTTRNGNFYIICAVQLLSKNVLQNDKRIISIIEKISGYEFKIINEY